MRSGTVDQTGYAVTQDNVLRRDTGTRASGSENISVKGEGVTLSVDPRSNSLIFYTTGMRYQTLLPMIKRLDVPPKQILLEAMIAEVTLTGEFAYGVEFAFSSGEFSGGTLGNLGLPDGGLALNWVGNLTDQVRLKLSATNSLVNVLSNPTLVVRDGVEATITVGSDIPTVGATASDPLQSDRQITQVLYRKTGLDLRIRPTINAEGVVVMEIDQSISNTVPGASAVDGAPVFFERAITHGSRGPFWREHPACRPDFREPEREQLGGAGPVEDPGAGLPVPLRQQEQGAHRAGGADHPAGDRGSAAMERHPHRNARGARKSGAPGADGGGCRAWRDNNACRAARLCAGSARLDAARAAAAVKCSSHEFRPSQRRITLFAIDKRHKQPKLPARTGLERAGLLLVVYNQQESKVPHGGPDVR